MYNIPVTDPSLGKMDRTVVKIARRDDPDGMLEYWLSRPLGERIRHAEVLRQLAHGYGPDARLPRVFKVTERESR